MGPCSRTASLWQAAVFGKCAQKLTKEWSLHGRTCSETYWSSLVFLVFLLFISTKKGLPCFALFLLVSMGSGRLVKQSLYSAFPQLSKVSLFLLLFHSALFKHSWIAIVSKKCSPSPGSWPS